MSAASRLATFATVATAAVLGTVCVTVISALVLTAAPGGVQASGEVHQLPRVVVTGQVQRSEASHIAQLPRVVVTGRVVTPTTAPSPLLAKAGESTAAGATATARSF